VKLIADSDALPGAVKEILFRAAVRLGLRLVLVASKSIRIPASPLITCETVAVGADSADDRIMTLAEPGDLVITADIPLADRVATMGGLALDPRGTVYGKGNIKTKLAMRDLSAMLRAGGAVLKGPPPFTKQDAARFARQLDTILAKTRRG
jgi:uncharacterized protein YaiI (UPF0178 family)